MSALWASRSKERSSKLHILPSLHPSLFLPSVLYYIVVSLHSRFHPFLLAFYSLVLHFFLPTFLHSFIIPSVIPSFLHSFFPSYLPILPSFIHSFISSYIPFTDIFFSSFLSSCLLYLIPSFVPFHFSYLSPLRFFLFIYYRSPLHPDLCFSPEMAS